MKKLLKLILLANISLLADITQLQTHYDNAEYEKVIQEAKASTGEYSNPRLHLLWAKSAEALGRDEEAMSAYERVTILDDTNVEAKLALMKIYRDTQRDDLAKETGAELQNYQLTPAQRASLGLLKDSDLGSLKAEIALSLGYDSNINVNPGSGALDDYYGLTTSEGKISTMFFRATGGLSYIHELQEKGGWYARGDVRAYYQENSQAYLYNLFLGSVEAGAGYGGEGYTFYLPISYDRVNYLQKDMLQQISFNPRANILISSEFIVSLNLKYTQRGYLETVDEARDDTAVGGGFGFYYLFDQDFVYFNAKYEQYSADNSTALKYIDKDMLTASMGLNYNIAPWLVGRVDYRFRQGSYDDNIGTQATPNSDKRSDDYHQVEVKFSHYLKNNFELYISDRYAKNSSNYVPAEYSKNVVMFGFGLSY